MSIKERDNTTFNLKHKREGPILKYFNTTAVCIPSKHYMVDITDRVKSIKN